MSLVRKDWGGLPAVVHVVRHVIWTVREIDNCLHIGPRLSPQRNQYIDRFASGLIRSPWRGLYEALRVIAELDAIADLPYLKCADMYGVYR